MSNKKVCVVMGSDSDFPIIQKCLEILDKFSIAYDVHVISAHRTPARAEALAKGAAGDGVGVIIAAAGKAAHLAGVIAAYTVLPVIGLPIKSSTLDGLDSLLSIVQMPKGIPVATVAIDGAENAAILATQILALTDSVLTEKLSKYKKEMSDEVERKDETIKKQLANK